MLPNKSLGGLSVHISDHTAAHHSLCILGGMRRRMAHRMVCGVQQQCPSGLMLALMILVVLLNAVWAESQDYYELLGVSKEANTREIRQAFKKLALTMHPDKNPVSFSKN